MKKPILLIYEEIPEDTNFYIFKDLNASEEENLLKCHCQFIGAVGMDEDLEEWLATFIGGAADNKIDKTNPIEVDRPFVVVHTGCML